MLVFLVISMTAVPVAADATSSESHAIAQAAQLTNSTLGVTTPISYAEVKAPPVNCLTDKNESQNSVPTAPPPEVEGNSSMPSFLYGEYLTLGQYMPCVTVARVTKHLWIYNGIYPPTMVLMSFAFSNPDEEYSRNFRVYVDGSEAWKQTVETTRLVGAFYWTLSNGMHEFIFEVYYGGYARGWALEYAEVETPQAINMETSAELAQNQLFPLVGTAQIVKYIYVQDYGSAPEMIHLAVSSQDPYSRYLRIRINDVLRYQTVIYRSYETIVDVSQYVAQIGISKITIEIQYGGYVQWNLVYLAMERTNSKYVPVALSLTLSFEFIPSASYLNDFIAGLRLFADHCWNGFEQQVIITRIDIYQGGSMWDSANIRVHSTSDFPPFAYMSYAKDSQGNPIKGSLRGLQEIHLPKFWPNDFSTWTTWPSYLAITHELAHAFFNVADEGITDHPEIECRSWYECVSIMDGVPRPYLFEKTEFCVRINHDPDGDTPQTWWWWGWSCWETIAYFYLDMYEPVVVYGIAENVASCYIQIVVH
jgi:hypothetical protein